MPIPPDCLELARKLNALQEEVAVLIRAMNNANPPLTIGKRFAYAALIKQLLGQISEVQTQYDTCLQNHGYTPLNATLTGTVSLTTTYPEFSGPFTSEISIGLFFDATRDNVILGAVPSITVGVRYETTITMTERAIGSYLDGQISLPITVHVQPRPVIPLLIEPSDLPLTLTTTGPSGSPVDGAGNVTMAGTGTFTGGPPLTASYEGTLTIRGVIEPHL